VGAAVYAGNSNETAQTTSLSMLLTQAHNETGLMWSSWTRREGRKRFCALRMSEEVVDMGISGLLPTDEDGGDKGVGH